MQTNAFLPPLPCDPPVNYGRPMTPAEWRSAQQWADEMRGAGVAGVERLEWGDTWDTGEPVPSLGAAGGPRREPSLAWRRRWSTSGAWSPASPATTPCPLSRSC